MLRRLIPAITALILAASLASGCTESKKELFDKSEHATLKVLGDGDERSFYSTYGDDFNQEYPNVEFEFVSFQDMASGQTTEEFIKAESPDIVIAQRYNYPELSRSGLLADLSPFVKRDEYDLSTFSAPVLDLLRATDGETLYGLAPYFNSLALFYNAALFSQFGIDPPRDGISWEQLFQLAQRFPSDAGVSGLSFDGTSRPLTSLGTLFLQVGKTKGLRATAPESTQPLINSEPWQAAANLVIDAYRSGTLAIDDSRAMLAPDDAVKKNEFASGRSAMTIGGFATLQLIDRSLFPLEGVNPVDYGIVAMPVDPAKPDVGSTAELGGVLCLYADSGKKEAAWAFIGYLGGDAHAKLKSRSSNQLLSRTSHQKELVPGKSLEPFYSFRADSQADPYMGVDPRVYSSFAKIIDGKLKHAVLGEVSVEEALDEAVLEGGAMLRDFANKEGGS
ncbi:hypothetical protein J19TS2_44160 [Cohnella xylanilytica]|uniref:ABC transporter substrate-binding protein n=1 Tax=Cohnella xylanilytica TaxID=557555 RepID=UPI001B0D0CBA|nr:extracellular solute-binding protein [Cohnella xylanilytica]GIO14861.1 hypothetical protein J19TS2_44160 [Cohnella xylanilytica]